MPTGKEQIASAADHHRSATQITSNNAPPAGHDANGKPNRRTSSSPQTSKKKVDPKDQTQNALYWSVLHHKNINEGMYPPALNRDSTLTESTENVRHGSPLDGQLALDSSIPSVVIHERQPLINEASSRSALTTGYESTEEKASSFPKPVLAGKRSSAGSVGWEKVRKVVDSKDLFIHHMANEGDATKTGKRTKRWSDFEDFSYEFTLRECLVLFLVLLAIGALNYSFIFEQWSILDSLYFTTVCLTTVGYGDITPTTPASKMFATFFALGGIVVLGLVLGVVGSQLVEAEIKNSDKMKGKLSKALEKTFTKGTRHHHYHHQPRSEEGAEHDDVETGSVSSSCSTSSMESVDSISSDTTVCTAEDETIEHQKKAAERKFKKQHPWLAVIRRHMPGFLPMLVGGLVMAMLEKWDFHDGIYYTIVTATTIGFGDLSPHQPLSKLAAIVFIPLVVAAMGYILGNVASFIVDQRRAEYDKQLWSTEWTMEDIEVLDEAKDGGVSELEYIKFMLVAMHKVDADLFDKLREQFREFDPDSDGKITKRDLQIMATRKMRKASHKLRASAYKRHLKQQGSIKGSFFQSAVMAMSTRKPSVRRSILVNDRETNVHGNH